MNSYSDYTSILIMLYDKYFYELNHNDVLIYIRNSINTLLLEIVNRSSKENARIPFSRGVCNNFILDNSINKTLKFEILKYVDYDEKLIEFIYQDDRYDEYRKHILSILLPELKLTLLKMQLLKPNELIYCYRDICLSTEENRKEFARILLQKYPDITNDELLGMVDYLFQQSNDAGALIYHKLFLSTFDKLDDYLISNYVRRVLYIKGNLLSQLSSSLSDEEKIRIRMLIKEKVKELYEKRSEEEKNKNS